MNNLLGWCVEVEDADLVRQAGYDFIECAVLSMKLETPSESRENIARLKNSPLSVKAVNRFFPVDMELIGPDVNIDRVKRYILTAAEALNEIGTEIAVLGSGRNRNVPVGWDPKKAEEQMLEILRWISDAFKGNGVTVVIEPLSQVESNLILSVSEAVSYARQINNDNVRVLADFYHMDEENDPLDTLIDNGEWLAHIHIADTGRLSPGTGKYPYADFFSKLQTIGYKGMISTECKVSNLEQEIKESFKFIKGLQRL